MKKALLIAFAMILFSVTESTPPWGFFGHKRINRLAVFTLPTPIIGFYKRNIEFVTEHAVDPDKRRYASKFEAIRHYIDLDYWGHMPFDTLPRTWVGALSKFTDVYAIQNTDTIQILGAGVTNFTDKVVETPLGDIPKNKFRSFVYNNVFPEYYKDVWRIENDSMAALFGTDWKYANSEIRAYDRVSSEGVVPYYLPRIERRLTRAMKAGDFKQILNLSADIGHYIGDASVPLHTTRNYNGQLTNQHGIHGFWESRIPELFADDEYNYFVGTAEYIENTSDYYWDIVLESHRHVEDVLDFEKALSEAYPSDQQYCQVERSTRVIRAQCEDYAKAYEDKMDGLVESRMRSAIKAVGNIWYTCWVNAGKPNLDEVMEVEFTEDEIEKQKELDKAYQKGKINGRGHE